MASGSKTVDATFTTSGKVCDVIKFSWWENSQSVANNSTDVGWQLELISNKYGYIDSSANKNWSVTVNGEKDSGTNKVGISANSSKVLASGTTTIAHNSNGTKTFSYSFTQELKINFNTYVGTISGSGSGTLTPIGRASQPSLITYPENTQNVGYFGDTISVHMNRKSPSFTHEVRYEFGSLKGTCIDADTGKEATAVTTGFRWTIPLSLMNAIPNGREGTGRVFVDTYNGSTLIGTKYSGFTAAVDINDASPSLTMTLEDTTNVYSTYGTYVQGLSKIKATATATTAYRSSVARRSITIDGRVYNSHNVTTDFIVNSGELVVYADVYDSRGIGIMIMEQIDVLPYSRPSITKLTVHRCNSDGAENEQGDCVKVTFSASVSSLNNKNTALYTVEYKKSTSSTWSTLGTDINGKMPGSLGNVYSVTDAAYIIQADGDNSYDIRVTAKDRHNTVTRSTSASTAFTLMDFNASGKGLGLGKVSEKDGLEIAFDVEFLGKVTGTIFDAILPVGSIVLRYDHTNPGTLYPGTTWARIYGAFPWLTDGNGAIGQTGGERTVTLTEDHLPAHNHGGTYTNAGTGTKTHSWLASGGSSMAYDTVNTGGGQPHNNMPPYIQVAAWRRTA